MRYVKILVNPWLWHLIPYKLKINPQGEILTEFGWLCFKLIITWRKKSKVN